jgi:hypothetical protein
MTEVTKMPERKLLHEDTRGVRKDSQPWTPRPRSSAPGACMDGPAWRIERTRPWPFKAEDTSPLAWWRTLPSDAFRDAERLLLLATLDQINVLWGGADFAAALEGDPAAAIGVAFSMMPIEAITLKADIAMTALLRCALERNASAALVLAQVLGLTDVGHSFATELAASWFTFGLRYSADPRKFSEAETVLLAAFRKRPCHGDDA